MSEKIFIAAGGTGGHVFPGIAIAGEIVRAHPEVRVVFVCTRHGMESRLIPRYGWEIVTFGSSSVMERGKIKWFLSILRMPFDASVAIRVILKERPRFVIGIGGYGAVAFGLACWILRRPLMIVEPNAVAGFANRVLGRFSTRVFVGFDSAGKYFPARKVLWTGNPVRREFWDIGRTRDPAFRRMVIFISGGSQGARRLNKAMTDALGHLGSVRGRISIIHQTGEKDDYRMIAKAYSDAGFEADVFPFTDRMWEQYAKADLIISRAGATSIAEILATGIPVLLVPYPYAADDHQRANAEEVALKGGALMIPDSECTGERLASEIITFLNEPKRLHAMAEAISGQGRIDAGRRIVEECFRCTST